MNTRLRFVARLLDSEIDRGAAASLLEEARGRVLETLRTGQSAPLIETLRRRSWLEMRDVQPVAILRRRLLHIERSAQRLALQAHPAKTPKPV